MATKTKPPCKQPEYVSEYYKQWYFENRDKHLAYCGQKITCECGRTVNYASYTRHLRSTYHKKRLGNQQVEGEFN